VVNVYAEPAQINSEPARSCTIVGRAVDIPVYDDEVDMSRPFQSKGHKAAPYQFESDSKH
jgi:hypothetical protein